VLKKYQFMAKSGKIWVKIEEDDLSLTYDGLSFELVPLAELPERLRLFGSAFRSRHVKLAVSFASAIRLL
jgi:hypothetical protein